MRQVNRNTDPDPAYYCSLALLQQPTQPLLCPTPFMTGMTKDCCRALGFNTAWSAHGETYLASYTKATQKPKEAAGTNTVFSNPQAHTAFISLRPRPSLSQINSCELAVAPAHLLLGGLLRAVQPLPRSPAARFISSDG